MSRVTLGCLLAAGLAVAAASAAPLHAAEPAGTAARTARVQLDVFTRGLKGLDSSFSQQVFDPNGRKSDSSAGTVRMSAPRQFRWEYRVPAPQTIVADGDHIWIYDPDLEQVTVRQQSLEEQNSPLAALIDPGELDRQFDAREVADAGGLQWLELTPKNADDAPFERARLGLGADGLAKMEMFDALGQRTVMTFTDWKRDPAFAKGTFVFVPPADVDVVGEVADGAEVMPLAD